MIDKECKKQVTVSKEIDYRRCPQHSARFLAKPENKENTNVLFYDGITSYIFKNSGGLQNTHEIQMICSSIDNKNLPVNVFMDNNNYFKTGPPAKDQFIGIRFFQIRVRPSAICIQTPSLAFPLKAEPLRSFIIVGRESENAKPVIIQEFSYTYTLKNGGFDIFFLNTDKFFSHLYIQQTCPSFDGARMFTIRRLEVHGLIQPQGKNRE